MLVSRHRCTRDGRLHIVAEDFVTAARTEHTLEVTYADPSIPEGELYEGRRAMMRYTRERDGDRVVSRKEVRFLDGQGDFETRSLIEQRLVRP